MEYVCVTLVYMSYHTLLVHDVRELVGEYVCEVFLDSVPYSCCVLFVSRRTRCAHTHTHSLSLSLSGTGL
jgi:hypothetical protein